MTVVIDGVALSPDHLDTQRVWRSILGHLGTDLSMRIVLLDRGAIHDDPDGILVVPFPSFDPNVDVGDSILLEQICRHFDADVFVSTAFTTPIQTPSVLVVNHRLTEREGSTAVAHARRFVCSSESNKSALVDAYPELESSPITVARAGDKGLVDALTLEVKACAADGRSGRFDDFARRWKELRHLQGGVDVWSP